jgi:DNA-binding CsgD family transcriptional regulator
MSAADVIAYAQRGRGGRKRPASGWASLTPAELDVVHLVHQGLPDKDIAERLYVSPRTVQAHLTRLCQVGAQLTSEARTRAAQHS